MGFMSAKLRASARGQDCTLRTIVCNFDPETTILCHLPSEIKGVSNKSDDFHAVFGCSDCHDAIDQHRFDPLAELFYCHRALRRTLRIWVEKGLIVVSGIDPDKPKTRPGKKANLPSKTLPRRQLWTAPIDRERD